MSIDLFEGKVATEGNINRILPPNNTEHKDKFSWGMLIVKPTGMSGDFSDYIKYLLDPKNREDENFQSIANQIAETMPNDYRSKWLEILGSTYMDYSFFSSYEPGKPPYFWEANYMKKNGLAFFYDSLLEEFKGGSNIEAYVLRSSVPQEELDLWVKRTKGKETLVDPNDDTVVLYRGSGVRGLVEVEAIMFGESDKSKMMSLLTAEEVEILNHNLEQIKLPVIFSRLPLGVQAILWDKLTHKQQQSMISNFVHSPDDIETVYDVVVSAATKKLGAVRVEEIIGGFENRSSAIFDLITEMMSKDLNVDAASNTNIRRSFFSLQ